MYVAVVLAEQTVLVVQAARTTMMSSSLRII